MSGLFITFEGVDGCGKSTQLKFMAEYLKNLGYKVRTTREPGGCKIAEKIRDVLLDEQNTDICAATEAMLYASARVQHVLEVIKPALDRGEVVLCDRFIDSSLAYQAYGRGLGVDLVMNINSYAMELCMPDITFFLDYPPELAFARMNEKKQHDRLEQAGKEFFMQVYASFKDIAQKFSHRIVTVDVSGTKFETRDKLRGLVQAKLKELRT